MPTQPRTTDAKQLDSLISSRKQITRSLAAARNRGDRAFAGQLERALVKCDHVIGLLTTETPDRLVADAVDVAERDQAIGEIRLAAERAAADADDRPRSVYPSPTPKGQP